MSGWMLGAALVLAQADVPAVEGVKIEQTVVHYLVEGRNASQIGASMLASGPVDDASGRRMFGYANVQLQWSYQLEDDGAGRCRLTEAEVLLDVRLDMPEWTPVKTPSARLSSDWVTFYARLLAHELGHRDIGVATAVAVRDTLLGMPEMPCEDVGVWSSAETSNHLQLMQDANLRYDRETGHGTSQGALWAM
jgi:predicted secreted Zn-dependent protease